MPDRQRTRVRWTTLVTLVLVAAVLVCLGMVVFDRWIMPPRPPVFVHPSAFDVLIESRLIVGLIRLIGIITALYVAISICAHIRGRRWLVAVGGALTDGEYQTLQRRVDSVETHCARLTAEYETATGIFSGRDGHGQEHPASGGDDSAG